MSQRYSMCLGCGKLYSIHHGDKDPDNCVFFTFGWEFECRRCDTHLSDYCGEPTEDLLIFKGYIEPHLFSKDVLVIIRGNNYHRIQITNDKEMIHKIMKVTNTDISRFQDVNLFINTIEE